MELRRFNIILIINILLAAILFSGSDTVLKLIFSIASIITVITISKSDSGYKSLRRIIIIVLIIGIVLMLPMFFYQDMLNNQINYLFKYMLFTLVQFLLWYIILHIINLNNEVEELRKKVFKREGLGHKKLILSNEEYNIRKDFIINGSKRRGETVYELEILVVNIKNEIYTKSLLDTVGEVLIDTVRENYDIIGKKGKDVYLILLQNMNDEKNTIVLNRFYKKLESYIVNGRDYLQINIHEIRGNHHE